MARKRTQLQRDVKDAVHACSRSYGNRAVGRRELYECVAERLYGPDARIQIANDRAHAEVSRQVHQAIETRAKVFRGRK